MDISHFTENWAGPAIMAAGLALVAVLSLSGVAAAVEYIEDAKTAQKAAFACAKLPASNNCAVIFAAR